MEPSPAAAPGAARGADGSPSADSSGARPSRPGLAPRDPRLTPWRAFLTTHAILVRRLDEDLQTEQGLSLAEYSALLQLAEAPGRRQRMNELAIGILLSRSGVTRLIDRLVADGLVTRGSCPSDGRGAEAILTEAGLNRLRVASSTHLRGIETYFLDAIEPADQAAIERAMGEVARRLPPAKARAGGRP